MALTHELESGGNLKDNLFIDLNAENRWGHVRYGGEVINAKVSQIFQFFPSHTECAVNCIPFLTVFDYHLNQET